MNVSVVGLGKLGGPLVGVLAAQGHNVIGVDTDPAVVAAVNRHRPSSVEPGLEALFLSNSERIEATQDYHDAIQRTQATFVLVPTPAVGRLPFSLDHVLTAADAIGTALQHKDDYHLVVLMSTVLPGATGGAVRSRLEFASGRRCGRDFGLCYCPEFVAVGSVIRDMLNPEYIILGAEDKPAADMLHDLCSSICEKPPRTMRMSYVNAELTKLAVNNFLTLKISFANMLAETCEAIPGSDALAVASAVGLDSRIGSEFILPATGYGGPCFPRDNLAWSYLSETLGVSADLVEAAERINRRQVQRIAQRVAASVPAGARVAVLGLSYKPNTDVVEHSQGVALAELLASLGFAVHVYDPAANAQATRTLIGKAVIADSMRASVQGARAIVLMVPWKEFEELSLDDLDGSPGPLIIDCWGLLNAPGLEVVRPGVAPVRTRE